MPEAPHTSSSSRVAELRALIERGDYIVDAHAVAGAIVERLQAGSSGRERSLF